MATATRDGANRTVRRIGELTDRLPGGFARTLWQPVLLLQDGEPDLSVGLYLSCAGSQTEHLTHMKVEWSSAMALRLGELEEHIESSTPRLLTLPISGINEGNYEERWGYVHKTAPVNEWPKISARHAYDTILVDGMGWVMADPQTALSMLHQLASEHGLIQMAAHPNEPCGQQELDRLRRFALDIGFGIRHAELAVEDGSTPPRAALRLGLVRLDAPMSDHPVLDSSMIMAHCHARLDLAEQLADGHEILDAGGWAGLGAARYLAAGAKRVVNLDISEDAISHGRKRFADDDRVDFVKWDLNLTPLPFDDESFDVVICLEVLEHITRQQAAVEEFFRILRPGGALLVSVPDLEYERLAARLSRYENAWHLDVPARGEFERLLRRFSRLRWFRQVDLRGSVILQDSTQPGGGDGGTFVNHTRTPSNQLTPQVVMALAMKPRRRGASIKVVPPIRPEAVGASMLRMFGEATEVVTKPQVRIQELGSQLADERYRWWSECNAKEAECARLGLIIAELEEANNDEALHEAEKETIAALTRMDAVIEEHERLKSALDFARQQVSLAQSQLTAAQRRAYEDEIATQREHNQSLEAELHQTRMLNETVEELRARLAFANQQTASADRIRIRRDAEIEQLRAHIASMEEAAEAVTRERAELAAQRAQLIELFGEGVRRAVDQVERRCLSVESRVFDLEDTVDQVDATPARVNGGASRAPQRQEDE